MRKYFFVVITFLVIFFVWYKVLGQTFLGEGYYYFDSGQNFFRKGFSLQPLNNYLSYYDNLPRLVFDILPPIFRDNLVLYQGFELLSLAFLSLAIFVAVSYITKNRWVGLISTLFFSTSYVGLFEMLAVGNYQRFVQRIPNFIFVFVSFFQLARYFSTRELKYLIFSLVIFTITTFMAHYSTFLLPLFIFYPLAEFITNKPKLKNFPKYFFVSLSFLLINLFIIQSDFYNPGLKSSSALFQVKDQLNLVAMQLSSISYPPTFLTSISKIAQPHIRTISLLSIPVLCLYLLGFYLIKKREPKYLSLYLTSVLTIFAILFLNISIGKIDSGTFVRGDRYYFIPVETLNQLGVSFVGGSRYYVLPVIFNSIVFSIILWVIFKKRQKVFYFLASFIVFVHIVYNSQLVWREIDQIQLISENMKIYLSYTKTNSDKLKGASVVVTPPDFIWASQMVRVFYGNDNLKFIPFKAGWEKEIDREVFKKTIILDFDYNNHVVVEKPVLTK